MILNAVGPALRKADRRLLAALEQPHAAEKLTAASLRFRSGRCRQVPLVRNVCARSEGFQDSP